MTELMMNQQALYPRELHELINQLKYKPNWSFVLDDINRGQQSTGLTLVITVTVPNSHRHDEVIHVAHFMPVPPAAYDVRSWRRWLLDQIMLVERHEACEFFTIGGVKPYAPSHGPGNDPYLVREIGTEEDQRTLYTGELPAQGEVK